MRPMFYQSNLNLQKVFMINEESTQIGILDIESQTYKNIKIDGSQFSLRYNNFLFKDFIGTYLDPYQQRMITNYSTGETSQCVN